MSIMMSPPPPPPPPGLEPSISADLPPTSQPQRQQRQHYPSFIEKWLVDEERKNNTQQARGTSMKKENIDEYFERQSLLPRHIPYFSMCNIEPMLYLITDFHAADNNHTKNDDNGGTTSITDASAAAAAAATIPLMKSTAWNDIRQIASHCATYKSCAEQNRSEFRYKRAVKKGQQQRKQNHQHQHHRKESTTSSTNNIGKNRVDLSQSNIISPSEQLPLPPPPPFHPKYTPLSLSENFLLSKMYSANYNICLAHTSCPQLSSRLLSCWKRCNPEWVQYMQQHGLEKYICMDERMAVERCVGRRVENAMKDILG